jgi:uncharacterized protein YqfB (UPF0267 family)
MHSKDKVVTFNWKRVFMKIAIFIHTISIITNAALAFNPSSYFRLYLLFHEFICIIILSSLLPVEIDALADKHNKHFCSTRDLFGT